MSIYLLQGALEEGLIYGLVALGLFVSYRILDIADMTTDGTFALGAVVSSVFVIKGHPLLALLFGILAGAVAGLITAFLQTQLEVPSILAGIITMTGLYSINLLVQGGTSNLFYPNEETVFSLAKKLVDGRYAVLVVMVLVIAVVTLVMICFFSTQLGLSIRATGDNREMVQASSINPSATITIGLCISNGLVGLGGALLAQKNTQGDINIGTGVVVIGLASLVLGGALAKKKISWGIIGAVIGSVLYRIIYTVALKYTFNPGYLKIVSALILGVVISYPAIKKMIERQSHRRRGKKNA